MVTLEANDPTTLTKLVNIDSEKVMIFVNYDSSRPSFSVAYGMSATYCLSVVLPTGAVATSGALLNTPAP